MNPEKNAVELEREMEKKKIREEIIRREELEAEVRREIMMEKQILGMRNFYGFSSSSNVVDHHALLMKYGFMGNKFRPNYDYDEYLLNLGTSSDNVGGKMRLNSCCPSDGSDGIFLRTNSDPCESNVIGSEEDKGKVDGVALGKWPFERDPNHVAAQVAEKVHAEVAELAEGEVMAELDPSAVIIGKKRKAETSARACDEETNRAMSKDSQKWFCSLCEVSATSEVTLDAHFRGKKHKAKESKSKANDTTSSISMDSNTADTLTQPLQTDSSMSSEQDNSSSSKKWECSLCQLSVTSEILLKSHLQGKKHKAKEAKLQSGVILADQEGKNLEVSMSSSNVNATDIDKQWFCSLCGVSASSENNLNDHLQGKKHRAKAGLPQQESNIINQECTKRMLEVEVAKDESLDGGKILKYKQAGSPSIEQGKDEECEPELIDSSGTKLTPEPPEIELKGNKASSLQAEAGLTKSGLTAGNKQETKLVTSEENKETENHGDPSVEFVKYWQCKMCNKGSPDEATMAAHRKSDEHMTLLRKHGGGLISVVSISKAALDARGISTEEAST